MYRILLFLILVINTNSFLRKPIKFLCIKKKLCTRNFDKYLKNDVRKDIRVLRIKGEIIKRKNNKIINDSKDLIIHSSIDTSSEDITDELIEVFQLVTDINKEIIQLTNYLIREFIKFNIYEKLNKEYKITIDTKSIFVIIVRNVIVPTIIHDIFQEIFNLIKN